MGASRACAQLGLQRCSAESPAAYADAHRGVSDKAYRLTTAATAHLQAAAFSTRSHSAHVRLQTRGMI